ncbi:MAG: glycosyltransferase family 4 protein [Peptoniphilaceae bacterium]|nr:glycosyltransferase family 4 protein [Peptoniphilaceae bacterium]MDY6086359.1 glycosyltransferase family 4 protein [Peptoniphilaceae bacterium]
MRLWIVNNYSIPPRFGGLVRHYYFSKFLRERGHDVRIITGSQIHNTDKNFADPGKLMKEMVIDGVPYTYVNTMSYTKNNHRRVINILQFTFRCVKVMKQIYDSGEHPDVILASSPLPTSAKTALSFAHKRGIPFVFEVRDLWPQSLVEYGHLEKRPYLKPVVSVLYHLEHALYRDADANVFTMAGGADYIRDRGWDDVDLAKVYQVNNGVDLDEFHTNLKKVHYDDPDLDDPNTFKIVYMGSIRPTYSLDLILDVAKSLIRELPQVRFYMYGGGTEVERLRKRCADEAITNMNIKGRVQKEEIPSILVRADLTLLQNRAVPLLKYGSSNNKLFEYLAAGVPILSTVRSRYSLIKDRHCGIETPNQSMEAIRASIREALSWSEVERAEIKENAQQVAREYDYRALSIKLEGILDHLIQRR